jgi:tetratricopeptide (TPR) repeat protein
MGLPELKHGAQSNESPMPESIRAQWKNLPTAFLSEPERRDGPEGGHLDPIEAHGEVVQMVDHEEDDKQSVCIQTLVAGNCKAYIELFYLTHMANAEAEEEKPDAQDGKDEDLGPRKVTTDVVANSNLGVLRELLTEAENSARANDAMPCYQANQQIAELFEDGEAWEASQTYYEKCLRIAKECGNTEGEAGAYCRLGQLHESAGNNELALEHHEKYLGLANASGMEQESSEALKSLVGTYMIRAEEMESLGKKDKAVEYYECCIRSAQECYDAHSEGIANHRLVKLW